MTTQQQIYDGKDWTRAGGKELQFYATDSEVEQWILNFLPEEFGPYRLVGSTLVKRERIYVQDPFDFALTDFNKARGEEISDFWILARSLTPEFNFKIGDPIGLTCSINGLILLQLGSVIQVQRGSAIEWRKDSSRIAITDKIINNNSDQIVYHSDYLTIYKHLAKRIKPLLKYSTILTFKDGSEEEDETLALMTEGVVAECQAGVKYLARPGRLLTKRR